MKTLIFGAGPLGSFYASRLFRAGADVTLLARGERLEFLRRNGVVLIDEMTGERAATPIPLVEELAPEEEVDLVLVLIRKNKLPPVLDLLAERPRAKTVLFMGNNALGFDDYLKYLPAERLLFGFPGAGGGIRDQVVHIADREKPGGKPRSVTLGGIDPSSGEKSAAAQSLFTAAGIPVDLTADIDGWLKYHVALVSPLACAILKHDGDCLAASQDKDTLRALVRAAKEGGRVLRALGYRKRQPFQFNLFYWLPEAMSMMATKQLLASRFAEIAFAMHAASARDEMQTIAHEFQELAARTTVATPELDALRRYLD